MNWNNAVHIHFLYTEGCSNYDRLDISRITTFKTNNKYDK